MEEKLTRTQVMAAMAGLSVLAFGLRLHQLKTAFDVVGARPGAGFGLFTVVTILAVLLFAFYAYTLRGRKKYQTLSSRSVPVMAVSGAAAVLLIAGSILLAVKRQQQGDLLIAVFGFAAGICWAGITMARYQGKKAPMAMLLIPAVYFVVALVCRFRIWTQDPVILDYCYDLFALISTMCALYHLGGYGFDRGSRRMSVFFTMCGVFFSAAGLAGGGLSSVLVYLAVILWLGGNLWLLLRPGKKRRTEEE